MFDYNRPVKMTFTDSRTLTVREWLALGKEKLKLLLVTIACSIF